MFSSGSPEFAFSLNSLNLASLESTEQQPQSQLWSSRRVFCSKSLKPCLPQNSHHTTPPNLHKRAEQTRQAHIPLLFVLCNHDTSTPCIFSILLSRLVPPVGVVSMSQVGAARGVLEIAERRCSSRYKSGSGSSDRQGECHDRERTMMNHSAALDVRASGDFFGGRGGS